MSNYYNRTGEPITLDEFLAKSLEVGTDLEKWDQWRRVARTEIPEGVIVSTVFLVHNHAFMDDAPPLIFETMVFGPDGTDLDCERYSTEAEAVAGHAQVVAERTGESHEG